MNARECEAIKPLISAALDEDLDETEFVQLSEHLASCESCRQIHQDFMRIRDEIRSAPVPTPPPQIARTVWQETVEKPPQPTVIRLASRVGLRWGISTMAASVVAVLVAVLFLAHGYDQRSIPTVASSQPEQGVTQTWQVSKPIEIEFAKQMDRDSVQENLVIRPTSEQERLPTSWSGNTLIIGRSESQSVLLRPDTDYRITVLENARDRHGNPLGETWVLQFRTGPPDVAIATPEPETDEATRETDTQEPESDIDPKPTQNQPTQNGGSANTPDVSTTPTDVGSNDEASSPERENEAVTPEPTAPPSSPEPDVGETETVEPEPTPAPEPTATPQPEPTATPKPDPTPQPTPPVPDTTDATQEPLPVRGAFGEVYWGNAAVQEALGAPKQEAHVFLASELEFQRGFMFRQHFDNANGIFVFVNDGIVQRHPHTFDASRDSFPGLQRDDGFFIPGGTFGKVWSENSDFEAQIGYAVSAEPIRDIDAASQQFDNGSLIFSRGNVYVIYSDNTWDVFQVSSQSSGGFQGSDDDASDAENATGADDQHHDEETPVPDVTPEPTAQPQSEEWADSDEELVSDPDIS